MSAVETPSAVAAPTETGPVEIFVGNAPAPDTFDADTGKPVEKAAPAETGNDDQGDTDTDGHRDDKNRPKGGVQNRIDELTRARREAEREAEYWKTRAGAPANPPAQNAAPSQKPTSDQFQTAEEYIEALADWKVEQKLNQRDTQKQQQDTATAKVTSWQGKLESARTEIPDFDAVVNAADMPVAPHVAELLFEHDAGAKLMHHFAQNPSALEKLNGLNPTKAAFELASIATKFEASPVAKPDRLASKAPPPARPVGSGRTTTPALGDMDMNSYIAARKAQGASWAR